METKPQYTAENTGVMTKEELRDLKEMQKTTSHYKIRNDNPDRKYFIITPRLVWVLSRNPYDYTFWCVVRDIAGEEKECFLNTRQIADYAMMSMGQAANCRDYWMNTAGLIEGEIRKGEGFERGVYHLRIPDFWEKNIEWCINHPKIAHRIEHKKGNCPNCDDYNIIRHVCSPHEHKCSPGETKKNYNKKNQNNGAPKTGIKAIIGWLRGKFLEEVKRPPLVWTHPDTAKRNNKLYNQPIRRMWESTERDTRQNAVVNEKKYKTHAGTRINNSNCAIN
jgi:hypothetical protein